MEVQLEVPLESHRVHSHLHTQIVITVHLPYTMSSENNKWNIVIVKIQ